MFEKTLILAATILLPLPAAGLVLRRVAADPQHLEGESLAVLSRTGGNVTIQRTTAYGWSGQAQVYWTGGHVGDRMVLGLPVARAGHYSLVAQFSRAPDYGIVQLYLDGVKLGGPLDLYTPTVVVKPTAIGSAVLSAGRHELAVEITGANPAAIKAYMFGLDWLEFWDPREAIQRSLADLGPSGAALKKDLDLLTQADVPASDARWTTLYERIGRAGQALGAIAGADVGAVRAAVEQVRAASPQRYRELADRLARCQAELERIAQGLSRGEPSEAAGAGDLMDRLQAIRREALRARLPLDRIVFAVRERSRDGHWYANIAIDIHGRRYYGDGGRLSVLDVRTGKVTHLVDDPSGGVRDPQVHYDGERVLFSYRRSGSEHYHLYEIGLDGSRLRQITDGPYDDIEPAWLPDGGIIFCSTRCNGWVPCGYYQTFVLYRCDPSGGKLRKLSSNITPENTPWVLGDGRVLYMRWEYVDRNQVSFQHLWTINPDGTGSMVFYGNQFDGGVYIDAKPIPGADRVVFVDSPGHGQADHAGPLAIADPRAGPDEKLFMRHLPGTGGQCYDPFPLAEDAILYSDGRSIRLADGRGDVQTIYSLPADTPPRMILQEPRAIIPRKRETVIPPRVDLSAASGRLLLLDVTRGRNMDGVRPAQVRKLLVLEQLQRSAAFFHGQLPYSFGGTFTLKRVLGTVPVEPDGSAYFDLPASRSIFFVALDENNMSVKRMQSFVTVQPGEFTGCVGCHESRTAVPPPRGSPPPQAAQRPPSTIQPIEGMPDVFDFPRDIQPILDRHCVRCHNPDLRNGKVCLTGDHNEWFSESFTALTMARQVSDGANLKGNRPPRSIGSSTSELMKKVGGGHHEVRLWAAEYRKVQLWIDLGANYAGTTAAAGTGEVLIDRSRIAELFRRRCSPCHATLNDLGLHVPPDRLYDHQLLRDLHLYNLTRPEKSWILLAPLARTAGGNGTCRPRIPAAKTAAAPRASQRSSTRTSQPSSTAATQSSTAATQSSTAATQSSTPGGTVFADVADADYLAILDSVRRAGDELRRIKRFDMPGFRPRKEYIRELIRFSILPPAFDIDKDLIDPYQADQAYWRSLWHRPR